MREERQAAGSAAVALGRAVDFREARGRSLPGPPAGASDRRRHAAPDRRRTAAPAMTVAEREDRQPEGAGRDQHRGSLGKFGDGCGRRPRGGAERQARSARNSWSGGGGEGDEQPDRQRPGSSGARGPSDAEGARIPPVPALTQMTQSDLTCPEHRNGNRAKPRVSVILRYRHGKVEERRLTEQAKLTSLRLACISMSGCDASCHENALVAAGAEALTSLVTQSESSGRHERHASECRAAAQLCSRSHRRRRLPDRADHLPGPAPVPACSRSR